MDLDSSILLVEEYIVISIPYGSCALTREMQPRSGVYTVGDFMTRKEDLHVVKPTTTVEEGSC